MMPKPSNQNRNSVATLPGCAGTLRGACSRTRPHLGLVLAFMLPMAPMACATGAKRVSIESNARVDDGGMSSQDFLTMSQQMASAIVSLHGLAEPGQVPRVAFLKVENRTSELMDTTAIQEKIRTNILKHAAGRVRFLDRSAVAAITAEREAKRRGATTGTHTANMVGADYFLAGSVSSIQQTVKQRSTYYMRFSFRLTDAETTEVVWEDEYEFKKVGTRALWDQ
jgi:PBP1b-binding outer membrane lipoprotein LpoB